MPALETKSYHNVRERNAAKDIILHDEIIGTEFFNFVCGDLLGSGISRYVFEYKLDKKYIVKVEYSNYNANSAEHLIWGQIEYVQKVSKWFAPIKHLTCCGRVMLQRKCQTEIAYDEYPKQVPVFFTDLKYQNWGMMDGRMVCFDYAGTLLLDLRTDYKLKNAKWWVG